MYFSPLRCLLLILAWSLLPVSTLAQDAGQPLPSTANSVAAEPLVDSTAAEFLAKARQLVDQGRHSEAIPFFEQTLQVLEAQPVSAIRASLLNELAVAQYRLGRLKEAESLYRDAILIYQTTEPRDEAGLATTLNNLAALHHRQRDFESAEPLYQQALQLRRKVLGAEHPNVAFSLNELAMLYHSQRRLEEAAVLYQESLAIEEKIVGSQHPELAPRLTNLAVIYRLQGLFNRAEPLFRRALEIQRQSLGPSHPEVAVSINNLAVLYSVMGRYSEAEDLYRQALAIQQQAFGARHISVAVGLRNLAILFDRQGDRERARQTVAEMSQILRENCASAATLSGDERAVCDNALAMQQQLTDKLGLSPESPPPATAATTPAAATGPTATQTAPVLGAASTTSAVQSALREPGSAVYRAQVRSSQDQTEAEQDLLKLASSYATALADVPGHIERVDLGPKGIWYRIQYGAFATSSEAQALCSHLNRLGLQSCWVAKSTN